MTTLRQTQKNSKSAIISSIQKAPTQIDWLTVKFNYPTVNDLDFLRLKKILEKFLKLPLTTQHQKSKGWVLVCKEAGIYIQILNNSFLIQFQGVFFAFNHDPLQFLRKKLSRISRVLKTPFYFTRADISRDMFGVKIEDFKKSFLKADTAQNLGRVSLFLSKKNLDEIETLQFRTEKRTIQFYRKDIQLLAKKEGSAYFAEYEARHKNATGKKIGSMPWTRFEIRINDAPALVPFLTWFLNKKVSYAELLSLALQHFNSKLYIRPNNGDSNVRRRSDCKLWKAVSLKNSEMKWANVMPVKKNDLRMTPVKQNALKQFESAIKNLVRSEVDLEKARDNVIPLALKFVEEFKDVEFGNPLQKYADTYKFLRKMLDDYKKSA